LKALPSPPSLEAVASIKVVFFWQAYQLQLF
jgi:hypothetical protein